MRHKNRPFEDLEGLSYLVRLVLFVVESGLEIGRNVLCLGPLSDEAVLRGSN